MENAMPERFSSIEMLEETLCIPNAGLISMMSRLEGDIMILGVAGKMGVTMARLAVNAIKAAGVSKRVIGVARFSNADEKEKLEKSGVETVTCNLLDREQVAKLEKVQNIIFMAGRKFGTNGTEEQTWAMNVLAPEYVCEHFKDSRIVAFSTGCVYPLEKIESCGSTEETLPAPVGEYSQSCLGRERIFQYYSKKNGTKVLLFRLNYAIDLRYGVLHDIALNIHNGQPVDNSVGFFNCIWQGDANSNALRSLELCESPCAVLNVTGPEIVSVAAAAKKMGEIMGKEVIFRGEPGNLGYLNNAGKMCRLFGYPTISMEQMIMWQAKWLADGGISIGKPTHFEVNNGKF
jgi:nucleoside-diphosphate-sugar epimerase